MIIVLRITPEISENPEKLNQYIISEGIKSGLNSNLIHYKIVKKSIDARKKEIVYEYQILFSENPIPAPEFSFLIPAQTFGTVLIAGTGPAGLFAALRALELGLKPILFERGKQVKERRRDLASIMKLGIVNEDSNYCFGEGGAGTYSDGKLYTRSGKRGDVNRILEILHFFGADARILYESHPHIGTNKLPGIIENIRKYIIDKGGEFHFSCRVTDLLIKDNKIFGVTTSTGKEFQGDALILATGHSSRDIYELLHKKNIYIESKSFALGVRIEHPQYIIDRIQYKRNTRGPYLPPASYSLVTQINGKGVFSFCMCPGGIIAPAATGQGEIVLNGWSPSNRNNYFANSGWVVTVDEKDFSPHKHLGSLAGLEYQKQVEQRAFKAGNNSLQAPAQRIIDFVKSKDTTQLPACSYHPGIIPYNLDLVLPMPVSQCLRAGLVEFGKRMPGFLHEDSVIVATESRTSSPVRIPRDSTTFMHVQIQGLFPCGEGAGYAGGIISAAMDGEKCARGAMRYVTGN